LIRGEIGSIGFQTGQQIQIFRWNERAGKAYPIRIKKGASIYPLHFSRIINNPNKSLVEFHPEYAKKMVEYEIEVLDHGKANDPMFDKTHYAENRALLTQALAELNANYNVLAKQAEQEKGRPIDARKEAIKADTHILKTIVKEPQTHVADTAVAKNVIMRLSGIPISDRMIESDLKTAITRINNKAEKPEDKISHDEREMLLTKFRYMIAFKQGVAGKTAGGQMDATRIITPDETATATIRNLLGQKRGVPRDIEPTELIKEDFPMRSGVKFPAPTEETLSLASLSERRRKTKDCQETYY